MQNFYTVRFVISQGKSEINDVTSAISSQIALQIMLSYINHIEIQLHNILIQRLLYTLLQIAYPIWPENLVGLNLAGLALKSCELHLADLKFGLLWKFAERGMILTACRCTATWLRWSLSLQWRAVFEVPCLQKPASLGEELQCEW